MRRLVKAVFAVSVLAGLWLTTGVASAQECEYPGVLMVLDRSASMQGVVGQRTKWEIARDAVTDMVSERSEEIDFGLMLYPGPSGGGSDDWWSCRYDFQEAGCSPASPRCTPGEVVLDVGRNSAEAIGAQLGWPEAYEHAYTPTWQSLAVAASHPQLRRPDRRNYVVLITDGWQCCGLFEDGNGGYSCEEMDRQAQVAQVRRLAQLDIVTFIIGFGGSVDTQILNEMALEAGTAEADCIARGAPIGADEVCYYQADDEMGLLNALEGIGRRISAEVCDGQDNDCDGRIDEEITRECVGACGAGQEVCDGGLYGACDAVAPQAEACDGVDNDCDGRIDEELFRPCSTACGLGTEICQGGAWTGCDAPPEEVEACDGLDNDCDGVVDPDCECAPGERRECGQGVGACSAGTQVCLRRGAWSVACEGGLGPQAEVCDGVDNDCDGQIDGMDRACQTACGEGVQTCVAGGWGACSAPAAAVEVCDGRDNDCDGLIDEQLVEACDGICGAGRRTCEAGQWGACDVRAPADEELCGNGVDDDCDGRVDFGCICEDGDVQPCGIGRAVCVRGAQACLDGQWGDCEGLVVHGQECPEDGTICDFGECKPPESEPEPGEDPEPDPNAGPAPDPGVGPRPEADPGNVGPLGSGGPEGLTDEEDPLDGFKPRGTGAIPATSCATTLSASAGSVTSPTSPTSPAQSVLAALLRR